MKEIKIVLYGCREIYCIQKKTDDIYKDIVEDVKTRFDASNYESDRPLPKEKTKNSSWINEK